MTSSYNIKWLFCHALVFLAFFLSPIFLGDGAVPPDIGGLKIESVTVDGSRLAVRSSKVDVGANPQEIVFDYSTDTNHQGPLRVRYRLDGFDSNWQENNAGFMMVGIRFYDSSRTFLNQRNFEVKGESPGWTGSIENSPLVHRRETLDVPPSAALVSLEISSAGPPDTVGVFVVANLTLSGYTNNAHPKVLIRPPLDQQPINETNTGPPGWITDGMRPSMATIVQVGNSHPTLAFAIKDDDNNGHAEWRAIQDVPQAVSPGEHLVLEWDEMFSIGIGTNHRIVYRNLPTGHYLFHVAGLDFTGRPTGAEASLEIVVPPPFWQRSWFIGGLIALTVALVMSAMRYFEWRKIRVEMQRLKNLQTLERERLRIANDIHDDLGARATQISLLSAMFQDKANFPEEARTGFTEIKNMSQDLISSLYETVWAVNPEYDHLSAIGDYLCQTVKQLCERTTLRCRLRVQELPSDVQVSSQIRHNISMAVKEAVHNVIKHANATEMVLHISLAGKQLDITVQDDGRGFQLSSSSSGNGLHSMRHRMDAIGGTFAINTNPGGGTVVHFGITIPEPDVNGEPTKHNDS